MMTIADMLAAGINPYANQGPAPLQFNRPAYEYYPASPAGGDGIGAANILQPGGGSGIGAVGSYVGENKGLGSIPGLNHNQYGWGSTLSTIGTAGGMLAGGLGLGTLGALAGTGVDMYNANQTLAGVSSPQLGTMDFFGGALRSSLPDFVSDFLGVGPTIEDRMYANLEMSPEYGIFTEDTMAHFDMRSALPEYAPQESFLEQLARELGFDGGADGWGPDDEAAFAERAAGWDREDANWAAERDEGDNDRGSFRDADSARDRDQDSRDSGAW